MEYKALQLKIWSSRSGVAENSSVLACDAVLWDERFPMFQKNVLFLSWRLRQWNLDWLTPRMSIATLRNVGNCLPKDSVASKKTWAFSNTAVTHYSAHVVLIESILVIIIRRRIKVLFITRTVVCLLKDVWRSTNLVHFCEAQIYVTPLLSRVRCQRQLRVKIEFPCD